MGIRDNFIKHFGEEEAANIEQAAREHANEINSANLGSDDFRWAVCICLGYECMSVDGYREYHGITIPWEQLDKWIIAHAQLDEHDGDLDYLGLFVGVYEPYTKLRLSR